MTEPSSQAAEIAHMVEVSDAGVHVCRVCGYWGMRPPLIPCPKSARCTHWRMGRKVGMPRLIDVRCTRNATHDRDHLNGPEAWNDASGEYREPTCWLCSHECTEPGGCPECGCLAHYGRPAEAQS